MKSEIEREYKRKEKWVSEMCKHYERLSPWGKFRFRLFTDWLILQQQFKGLPLNWIQFVLDMERQIEVYGMPFRLKLQLEKWFNNRPYPDVKEYFLWEGEKIWHYSSLEDDNFELHLRYKSRLSGNVWLQLEKDGTVTIIGIHIQEDFRNAGLGTVMFQEAVRQISDRTTCIKGILEKEYYPEPEDSLRWLRKQGFEIKQTENGDYELELWLS